MKRVLGHSIGEYSALYSSNSIDLLNVLSLVKIRGREMQNCSDKVDWSMVSLNPSPPLEDLYKLIRENFSENEDVVCEIATINSPNQIVISGHRDGVDKCIELSKKKKLRVRKAIPLSVSGPFHCSLMEPASLKLKSELEKVFFEKPDIPWIPNLIGEDIEDPSSQNIREMLFKGVVSTVKWRQSIEYCFENHSINQFYCFGGKDSQQAKILTQTLPNAKVRLISK